MDDGVIFYTMKKNTARSGKTFVVHNPATGELLAELPLMGAAEARGAIDAAVKHASPLGNIAVSTREAWLHGIVAELEARREELARTITMEQGKPLAEARVEVDYGAGFFRYYATHMAAILQPREVTGIARGGTWTVHHRPAGVAALITPWNFPFAMLAKKLSAALAAGCPVVVKPAEATPLSTFLLWEILKKVGLPRGWANLVVGDAAAIGSIFCSDDRVRILSFTGSTAVGRLLAAQSAQSIKRLALELGGNAPFIVFEDADLSAAATALIANKFRCAGQTCVCTNRVYVHQRVRKSFTEAVVEQARQLKVGNGLEEGIDLGPLINRAGHRKVSQHVADALAKGAKSLLGSIPSAAKQEWGCYFPPTVLTGCTAEMRLFQEETFGPVISMASFTNEKGVLAAANGTPYGLAAYVFTSDPERANRVAALLHFGHVAINSAVGPTPEAPFGGFKQSGYGREGGIEGLVEFTEPQTVASERG